MNYLKYFGVFLLLVSVTSCAKSEKTEVEIKRFDNELFHFLNSQDTSQIIPFLEKYNDFTDVYIGGVLGVERKTDETVPQLFRRFFKDSTLMKLYSDEQATLANIKEIEADLSQAMSVYHSWFPTDIIPQFQIHVSGLAQSVVTTEKLVSIAGDKYLGVNYPLYYSFFYDYQRLRMDRLYISADALFAFLQGKYTKTNFDDLLDQMVYNGILTNAIQQMLPQTAENRVLGFNETQMEWLIKNESSCWLYMVENEQLYSADPMIFAKYIVEGPFTSYFGSHSPARIGVYIGHQIVKSYLKKRSIPVNRLLTNYSSKTILSESGYRP